MPHADPIPAPGFVMINRHPRDMETEVMVQFANGYVDRKHTYKAKQLRWTKTGDEWDIAAAMIVGG